MMTVHSIPRRLGAVALFTLAASMLSCGREITGPQRGQRVEVAFAPRFASSALPVSNSAHSVASLVPFERVRIVLRRGSEEVVDRLINFPSTADSVALNVSVPLSGDGGSEGEQFEATLKYINAQGDTVFSGGPITVFAVPGSQPGSPVEVPMTHVGPGANAVSVQILPDSQSAPSGATVNFTATAFDAQASPVANAVIGFVARDPQLVTIPSLGVGTAQLTGVRGTTYVYAELISGAVDSAMVVITPVPNAIVKVSGDAQQTLSGSAFAQPLRVRVTATDGLGVSGVPVTFTVTAGGGQFDVSSLLVPSPTQIVTDANGFAELLWVAGPSAGAASVTASIASPAATVSFAGTQLSAGPTTLEFTSSVANITAGETLPNLNVIVKNGLGQTISNFTGAVGLTLSGGTAGAQLLGVDTVNATAGVASFSELTVDRAGTGYVLTARAVGFTASATTGTFDVAPAPPELLTLVSGGAQSAPPNFPLADSIRIRVTDQFGLPVAGQTVSFNVTAGGGAVLPSTAVSDADGRAATQWLLGSSGVQTLEVTLGTLESIVVGATVVGGVQQPAQLFAGFDFLNVAAGREALVPIYLSAPSVDPITVTLTSDDTLAVWSASSVIIPAGVTRLDVPITGLRQSSSWAFMTSSAGDDSLQIIVDSAWVSFAPLDFYEFFVGDTIQTIVRLSDPAPVGGVLVTIQSLDESLALVAPSSGKGTPVPACVSEEYCFGVRAPGATEVPSNDTRILAPFAASTDILIPEGQLSTAVAIQIVGNGGGFASVELTVEAAAHQPANAFIDIVTRAVELYNNPADYISPLGVGQTMELQFAFSSGASTREREITVVSRNPAVATVEPTARVLLLETLSSRVRVEGLSAGTSWMVFSSPGLDSDSVQITVSAPSLQIAPGNPNAVPGGIGALLVRASAPGSTVQRERATSLPITVRVSNPSVVVVDQAGVVLPAGETDVLVRYHYVGVGTSWIVVEAADHTADSTQVSSTSPGFITAGSPTVGVGLTTTVEVVVAMANQPVTTTTVNVTSLTPGLVRVLTPQLELRRGQASALVKLEGLGAGAGTIRISGGPYTTTDIPVQVLDGTMTFLGFSTLLVPNPALSVPVLGITVTSGLVTRPPADSVFAILRSSNPGIVLVTDSTLLFEPGQVIAVEGGTIQPLTPGVAQLTLHAPQLTPSAPISITVQPLALTVSTQSSLIGTRYAVAATIRRNAPTTSPLPVTLTQEGAGSVSVLQGSITIPADSAEVTVDLVGQTAGPSTLIFSAAGVASDTVVATVDASTIDIVVTDQSPSVGYVDSRVFPLLRIGESPTRRRPGQAMRFVLSASDTTKVRVLQDTVAFAAGVFEPTRLASIRYLQPGDVDLTFKSVEGLYPDEVRSLSIDPATLTGGTSYSSDAIVLGMNHATYFGEIYVDRDFASEEPMYVYLTSSAPGLLTIPDSVLIPAGEREAIIEISAGDSIGSARITASAPGWNPWEFDVFVTRAMLQPNFDDGFVGGQMGGDVYVMDMLSYYSRPLATTVPLLLSVEDPTFGVFDENIVNFPAGEAVWNIPGPRGLRTGTSRVYASDARSNRFELLSRGGDEITMRLPAVEFALPRYQAGQGLRSIGSGFYAQLSNGQDSTMLRFKSLRARTWVVPDSVPILRSFFGFIPPFITQTFELVGLSPGIDTVVVSADGFISDSAVISIEPGILSASEFQVQTIALNDSVRVSLQLLDPAGQFAQTAFNQTLSVATDPSFVVTDGTATVTTLELSAAVSQVEFWVKAVSPGTGEIVVSGTNFRPLRLVFTTRVTP